MARSPRCRDMDLLWKHYFRDPSSLCHSTDPSSKRMGLRSPDFQHRITDECHNPSWVYEERRRTGMLSKLNINNEKEINIESYKEDSAIVTLLKSCAKSKDLRQGTSLHADILRKGLLERSRYVASSLIHMYAKCGALAKAQQVLKELPYQDVVSWSALISGFVQQGKYDEALRCYYQMQTKCISPNAITFTCILKACGNIGILSEGKKIHEEIVSRGFLEKDIMLGTALVDMYAKCGMPLKAQEVFEELPNRDVVTWSALIAGYAQEGQGHKALVCFEHMKNEGFSPDSITFICLLKACGVIGALNKGKEIHGTIVNTGVLKKDIMLGNVLVDMYVKCGTLTSARRVVDELSERNEVTWNTLIAGYVEHEQYHEAVNAFEEMRCEGFLPDSVTFICILKACGNIGAIDNGKQIHVEIVRKGLMKERRDLVLATALVDMYAKCGLLTKAKSVLEELPIRDVVTWNTLIAACIQRGQCQAALECFERMQSEGITPDGVIFTCILNACSIIGAIDKGKQIHDEIEVRGLLQKDLALGNALVGMYSKCGMLSKAREVLRRLPTRDIVTWSLLIGGYLQQEKFHEVLDSYERMLSEGHSPDSVTFICVLKACGSLGAVEKGEEIHEKITTLSLFEEKTSIGNALVDMYAKCGMLRKAQDLFDTLPYRDVVAWTSLITGHAQQGKSDDALACFEGLLHEGIVPNEVSFLCVLNACYRSGLVIEAGMLFESMTSRYNLTPNLQHYTCMMVGLGYAGNLGEAFPFLEALPFRDDHHQLALLCVSRRCLNAGLGSATFDQIISQ